MALWRCRRLGSVFGGCGWMFKTLLALLACGALALLFSGNAAAAPAPVGALTEFTIPTANSNPEAIAAGPDGNLWFAERNANQVGRVTPTGTITEFTLPTASSVPGGIA